MNKKITIKDLETKINKMKVDFRDNEIEITKAIPDYIDNVGYAYSINYRDCDGVVRQEFTGYGSKIEISESLDRLYSKISKRISNK